MRIGIDLDGVCYNFAASLRRWLTGYEQETLELPNPKRWEFYLDWGMTEHQFGQAVDQGVNDGIIFMVGEPFPGVGQAFDMFRARGHTIHIVTDRHNGTPGAAAGNTIAWLHRNNLKYESITFTADKTTADVDVLIDDKPENCRAMINSCIPAILIDRPWNQGVNLERSGSLLEVAQEERWGV